MNNLHEGSLICNRYLLIRLLDQGGMASVWLARDTKLNSDVALKFLSEKLSEDISAVNNFRAEWEISSKLVHPNIVKVFDGLIVPIPVLPDVVIINFEPFSFA